MLKISGLVFCEIIIYGLLKQYKSEYAVLSEITCAVIMMFMLGDEIGRALGGINMFIEETKISSDHIKILIKILGLALITQFTADLCRDSGETAAASKVEFAGKVIITAASLPVIKSITGLIVRMVNGI